MLFAHPNSSFRFCSRFQVSFSTVRGKKIVELTARCPREQDSIIYFFVLVFVRPAFCSQLSTRILWMEFRANCM